MKNLFLTLVLVFTCLPAWSQVKHIVFNMDGILVQQIPSRNYNKFTNKDQMFQVTVGGRTSFYYIYPYTSYLLNYLQKQSPYVIHFFTHQSDELANAILKTINLPKPISAPLSTFLEDSAMSKLFTSRDMVNGKFDLRKVTSDTKNVLFVTSFAGLLPDEQKENELNTGRAYFYYETYADAAAERANLAEAAKVNIAASQSEWFTEQNKMAYIYSVLKEAKVLDSANAVGDIQKLKIDPVAATNKGLLVARYKFEEKVILFKYNADKTKVTGCGVFSPVLDKFIEDKPLDKCLPQFSVKYKYKFNEAAYKTETCQMIEEATSAHIRDVDMQLCFNDAKSNGDIRYYWQGIKRVTCGAYLGDYYVQNVDKGFCEHLHIISENGKNSVRAFFEVNGELVSTVPEVYSMRVGGILDPNVYRKYSSILIGQSLIRWIYDNRDAASKTDKPNYDFYNDSRIVMGFNFTLLDSIVQKGFLNQHNTGTSNGCNCPGNRAVAEDKFISFQLESSYGSTGKVVHDVRPKYSFFVLDKYRPDMVLTQMYAGYGNVHAVFKNHIKDRSTFTPGDSLGMGTTDVRTMYYTSKNVLKITGSMYWEAQIWGKLTMDEVDYFLVNCLEGNAINSSQIAQLKKVGKPVYACNPSFNGSYAYNVTKGAQL